MGSWKSNAVKEEAKQFLWGSAGCVAIQLIINLLKNLNKSLQIMGGNKTNSDGPLH